MPQLCALTLAVPVQTSLNLSNRKIFCCCSPAALDLCTHELTPTASETHRVERGVTFCLSHCFALPGIRETQGEASVPG